MDYLAGAGTGSTAARVHGRFATIYASGCAGIRFGVLPLAKESFSPLS